MNLIIPTNPIIHIDSDWIPDDIYERALCEGLKVLLEQKLIVVDKREDKDVVVWAEKVEAHT